MEEHIRLFAMDGDVAGGAGLDGVWRRGDVLGISIVFAGLAWVCLYGCVLAQVGIGDEQLLMSSVEERERHCGGRVTAGPAYMRIFGGFQHAVVDVVDLDIPSRDWIPNSSPILALLLLATLVRPDLAL